MKLHLWMKLVKGKSLTDEELEDELFRVCDELDVHCYEKCPVFTIQQGLDGKCPFFRNGAKMLKALRESEVEETERYIRFIPVLPGGLMKKIAAREAGGWKEFCEWVGLSDKGDKDLWWPLLNSKDCCNISFGKRDDSLITPIEAVFKIDCVGACFKALPGAVLTDGLVFVSQANIERALSKRVKFHSMIPKR